MECDNTTPIVDDYWSYPRCFQPAVWRDFWSPITEKSNILAMFAVTFLFHAVVSYVDMFAIRNTWLKQSSICSELGTNQWISSLHIAHSIISSNLSDTMQTSLILNL